MDYKKAQIIALAMIASSILSGMGLVAMAIRPMDEGYLLPIIGGGIPFFLYMKSLYNEIFSKK